jgi:hypothetical protein
VTPADHAVRGKPNLTRPIWRIFNAQPASGGKSIRPVRVCHILQVQERGDRGLGIVSGVQGGVVHRSQLGPLGISRGSLAHRVKAGKLHPVFPSVWAVGHPALVSEALEIAALLYAGPDAVLSHRSAAALWRVGPRPGCVEVTVAGRNVRPCPGLGIHRVAALDARDVRLRAGLPVTAPARTMIDVAGCLEDDDLAIERALAELRVLGLATDSELRGAIDRGPTRKGAGRVRWMLDSEAEPGLTRSEAERLMFALCARAQLPRPLVGARPRGFPIDFLWPAARLVVEVDGLRYHGHARAFETDRRRDQILVAAGYRVIRITWHQLTREPMATIARLAQALVAVAPP